MSIRKAGVGAAQWVIARRSAGKLLKDYRRRAGNGEDPMRQAEFGRLLAEELGVSPAYTESNISGFENAREDFPAALLVAAKAVADKHGTVSRVDDLLAP